MPYSSKTMMTGFVKCIVTSETWWMSLWAMNQILANNTASICVFRKHNYILPKQHRNLFI